MNLLPRASALGWGFPFHSSDLSMPNGVIKEVAMEDLESHKLSLLRNYRAVLRVNDRSREFKRESRPLEREV